MPTSRPSPRASLLGKMQRGLRPRIIDPAGKPGAHACSWRAGGMLAPYCEAESAEPVVLRLGRERLQRGEARHEARVIADHGLHLSLLQHDFRHPHAVGFAALPRQIVATVLALPDNQRAGEFGRSGVALSGHLTQWQI